MTRRLIPFALVFAVGALVAACSVTPSPTVTAVTISGAAPTVGNSAQFKAIATFSDGSTQDVTNQTTIAPVTSWVSSNGAVATVSATGLVTGVSDGSVTIQATYLSFTGNVTILITG